MAFVKGSHLECCGCVCMSWDSGSNLIICFDPHLIIFFDPRSPHTHRVLLAVIRSMHHMPDTCVLLAAVMCGGMCYCIL